MCILFDFPKKSCSSLMLQLEAVISEVSMVQMLKLGANPTVQGQEFGVTSVRAIVTQDFTMDKVAICVMFYL